MTSTETVLYPTDVNASSFGKLSTYARRRPGRKSAAAYVAGVNIPGQGVHNVLYVATEGDSLYAFDADNGVRLWKVSVLAPGELASTTLLNHQLGPEIGITATPVIDPSTGRIYVEAMSETTVGGVATYRHRLDR